MSICRHLDIGIGSSGFSSTCLLYSSLKGLTCLYYLRFLGDHRQTCGISEVRKHEELEGTTGEALPPPEVFFFKPWFDIFDSWCRIIMFIVCPQTISLHQELENRRISI